MENRGAETGLGKRLWTASGIVFFAAVAQNMINPHSRHDVPYEKYASACFGDSSMSHTQNPCLLGPGEFEQNKTVGVYRNIREALVVRPEPCSNFGFKTGGVYSRVFPVSA